MCLVCFVAGPQRSLRLFADAAAGPPLGWRLSHILSAVRFADIAREWRRLAA